MPGQPLDAREDLAKEGHCQVTLSQLQGEVSGMSNEPAAGLEQNAAGGS